jgi:cytochrome c oxidase subunit 3
MCILKNRNLKKQEQHPFHIVDPSPWPIITSLSLYSLALGFIMYFHYFKGGLFQLIFSFCLVILSLFRWFYDIVVEATYEGYHTFKVQQNILLGMVLFITSEVMFFFAFFWAFFHFTIVPSIWVGGVWPLEKGFLLLDFFGLPLLNTCILISSGFTVTWAHHCMCKGDRKSTSFALIITIVYGAIFSLFQKYEYNYCTFSINDGAFGSAFYMLTGFHGLHVFIGTLFLFVCLVRHLMYHFGTNHHVGFICGIWYWHFVDVVWLILFIAGYAWGSFQKRILNFPELPFVLELPSHSEVLERLFWIWVLVKFIKLIVLAFVPSVSELLSLLIVLAQLQLIIFVFPSTIILLNLYFLSNQTPTEVIRNVWSAFKKPATSWLNPPYV